MPCNCKYKKRKTGRRRRRNRGGALALFGSNPKTWAPRRGASILTGGRIRVAPKCDMMTGNQFH